MITNHDIRRLVNGITATGAPLPADITAMLNHVANMAPVNTTPRANATAFATNLLPNLGDPAAFDKALHKAAEALSRQEASDRILAIVSQQATSHAFNVLRSRADELAGLVATALAPHFDALNTHAKALGPRFTINEDLTSASNDELRAFRATEDARAVVEAALDSLGLFYRPGEVVGRLTRTAWRRLPAIDIPDGLDLDHAIALADAIEGIRLLGGGASVARHDRDGYWPARVAALGVRFSWATPAETRQRGARLRVALTPQSAKRPEPVSA